MDFCDYTSCVFIVTLGTVLKFIYDYDGDGNGY